MYESFYQLQTNPFSLMPDPKFCYSHSGYMQAREYLDYALMLGEGFVMVTGRPGTGKTTLVESFLATLNIDEVKAARIAASSLDAEDLLRAVSYAFNLEAEGQCKATLRHRIKQFLDAQLRSGRRALLIIDEAQNLPRPALEELRLLADLQAGSRQLLQLFLVGQEPLREQISSPEMDHFQQRVIANYHLVPLGLMESRAYMEFRLRQAGWRGDPEITGDAVLDIFRFSKGVPRHINKLCNRLLLLGYGNDSHILNSEDVQVIAEEMDAELLRPIASNQSDEVTIDETLDIPEKMPDLLSDLAIRIKEQRFTGTAISAAAVTGNETGTTERLASHGAVDLSSPTVTHDPATTAGPATLSAPAGLAGHAHDHIALRKSSHTRSKLLTAATGMHGSPVPLAVMLIVAALSISAVLDKPEEALSHQDAVLATRPELPSLLPTGTITREQPTPATQVMVTAAVFSDTPLSVPVADDAILKQVLDDELPATAAGLVPEQTAMLSVVDEKPEPPVIHVALVQDIDEQAPVENIVSEVTSATDMTVDSEIQTGGSRETEIEDLITRGRRALEDNRLLTPALDSAYHYYQSTLRLEPGNEEALDGIEQIVERYVLLTNKALAQRERMKANRYIARGLSLQPDNSELLALKEELQLASDNPGLEGDARSRREDTRKRSDNVFSLIKAFFANNTRASPEALANAQKTSSYVFE